VPKKDLTKDFKMLIIRSFNVNHPRSKISELKGGVIGGTLRRGIINVEQDVIIYPGYISKNDAISETDPIWKYKPLISKVLSINTDKNALKYAIPGGQIGVQLNVDPCMTGDDMLVGQIVFRKDKNIEDIKVYEHVKINYKKLKNEINGELLIKKGNTIQINVNSNNVKGIIRKLNSHNLYLELEKPICVELNDTVTINLMSVDGSEGIQLFGSGFIVDGISSKISL
jgi:translation initiation factor 2 subunit 3